MVKRCMATDMGACSDNPRSPCCSQYMINRFYPIGPYVQPTLMENWVSALFQFGGENPVGFTLLKTVAIVAVAALLTLAWGWLGMFLGIIPTNPAMISEEKHKSSSEDRSDAALNVIEFEPDEEWMDKLRESQNLGRSWIGVKQFACCLSQSNSWKCMKKPSKRKKEGSSSSGMIGCISDLMYDIHLGMDQAEDRRDQTDSEPSKRNLEGSSSRRSKLLKL